MDAVEYIKERERMCDAHDDCDDCGLRCEIRGLCGEDAMRVEDVVRVVEQWSKDHPIVTNAQKFKEIYGFHAPVSGYRLSNEWWDEPYKEPEGKE